MIFPGVLWTGTEGLWDTWHTQTSGPARPGFPAHQSDRRSPQTHTPVQQRNRSHVPRRPHVKHSNREQESRIMSHSKHSNRKHESRIMSHVKHSIREHELKIISHVQHSNVELVPWIMSHVQHSI